MTDRESRRHERIRKDHRSETAEDYVEAVAELVAAQGRCRVVDLARYFAVSHATVSKIVKRLVAEGLLDSQPYQPIVLTPRGARLARKSRQRHETIYRFLLALGISPPTAEIDAEGIEHHVSQETLRCFERYLKRIKAAEPT